MLNERIKQLIPQARMVSFAAWQGVYPEEILAIFQQADEEKRYLTDEELAQIEGHSPATKALIEVVKVWRDRAAEIVSEARQSVLAAYPKITEPGGGLYPPERAEACWRDFWHFLRCMSYGVAGNHLEFTSPEGLEKMQLLYQEMQVPLEAMVCGLENLKRVGLAEVAPEAGELAAPYCDRVIEAMKAFQG